MKEKIVIIGAGPAGLTTAYKLLKSSNKKYDVTILEKDSMVGGISKTINYDGYRFDTGIHRFFSKNDEVNIIWKELLPLQNKKSYDELLLNKTSSYGKKGSNPEIDKDCMLIKNRITRIYYDKKFFDYPISLNTNTLKKLGIFNIIKVGCSYIKSLIFKKKEISLENFYINRFGKKLYSMFFKNYTEKVWGIDPKNISADWGAQRVKGISIREVIKDAFKSKLNKKNDSNTETSLIESFIYPKYGAGQMWEKMSEEIINLGGKVILNANVTKIFLENNNIKKVKYNNLVIDCDKLISSMPIKDLIESINKNVPKEVYDISSKLQYREFMSVILLTKKINWKNNTKIKTINNILPDSWDYIQDPSVKMGRIQLFNNWSPYLFEEKKEVNNKVLLSLEYFCNYEDKYWKMIDEKFINFAIKEAIKINLINSKKDVIKSYRIKIEKAYPAYFGVYKDINVVIDYLNNINNLYCIGRNGQHKYNNMDHSMLTGIETANIIIKDKKDKSIIWKVNTEKEYHEIKKQVN